MTSKTEYKPKTVKIHHLEELENLLDGVKVASCMLTEPPKTVDEASVIRRVNALALSGASRGDQCSSCGAGPFGSRAQQTAHYKHHWHAYNVKRRLFGKPPLTLQQFNARQDDNSSVSSSESEAEETKENPESELFAAATRHCKAFFTNAAGQVYCIYRCLLHHRKEDLSIDGEGKPWVQRCKELLSLHNQRWSVFMVSGGHFAGAIFLGGYPTVHKTLHSYVVRRGQGQAQATRDQHGHAPKSAGASLRRYNQEQFLQHIQDILVAWTDDIKDSSLILYRAVGPTNQAVLFGKVSPIRKDDPRVRQLPFPTRKPSFKEVQRAYATLSNIDVYETMELFQKALMASSARPPAGCSAERAGRRSGKPGPAKPIDRAKSREPVPRELPTQVTSSEDEGPCFIDSETPADWIKTLSQQTKTGVISNSRKDLLNDNSVGSPETSEDEEVVQDKKKEQVKKRKKKKPEEKKPEEKKEPKKQPKIPNSIKKLWQAINDVQQQSLDTILERWECELDIATACNAVDPRDGNTALHKAAVANKPGMVDEILSAGGDPCIKNRALLTPYAASSHHDARVAFRMFQARFPDRYNYAKSHIPGPVTPELLEEERARKVAQKRAKRQRDKEKQLEKIRSAKFLELSDEQKIKTGDQRCFLCGAFIPKTPFDYDTYQFCSVKCLQNHRSLRPLNMTA